MCATCLASFAHGNNTRFHFCCIHLYCMHLLAHNAGLRCFDDRDLDRKALSYAVLAFENDPCCQLDLTQ